MSNPQGSGPPYQGTKPMEPVPPEVQAYAAKRATPFENTPRQPSAQPSDGALPFVSPGADGGPNGMGHGAGLAAISPKSPPRQLTSPGVLSGLAGFQSHFAAASVSAAAATAPAVAPVAAAPSPDAGSTGQMPAQPPAATPPPPITAQASGVPAPPGPVGAAPAPPPPVEPPPAEALPVEPPTESSGESTLDVDESAIAEAASPAGGPPGEHPLAATNSPWTQTSDGTAPLVPLPSAEVLPSAQVAPPPVEQPREEAVVARAVEESASSRTAMTIGLAIAAVALIALVAYFMTAGSEVSDDPTSVGGVEQRDYGDEPPPNPTASATAKPAPRPIQPRSMPKAPAGDIYEQAEQPKPPSPADDIYDDL